MLGIGLGLWLNRSSIAWTPEAPDLPDIISSYPAWLSAVNYREAQFNARCPSLRATNYYFSQSGDDTTGDGSIGNPWKTQAKCNAEMAPDTGFFFKRGDVWEEDLQITVDEDNVTIGAYGTGDKPFFNAFSRKIVSASWTDEVDDIYSISIPAIPSAVTIGWVRLSTDRLGEVRGNILAEASSATGGGEGGSTLTTDWWYQDTGTNTLYVYLNGDDPSSESIEYSVSNELSGVRVQNVDGCRVENLRIDGYSLSQTSGNHNNGYNIMTTQRGEKVVYVKDNDCYFGSAHVLGQLQSFTGGGGISMYSGNTYGFSDFGGGSGETLLNFFTGSDGGQAYDINNVCAYGTVPTHEWDFETEIARGRAVYAHSTGGNNWDFCVSLNLLVEASHAPAASVGGFADVVDTGGDISLVKAFVVNAVQEKTSVSALSDLYMGSDTIFYANYYAISPLDRASGALWTSTVRENWWVNCVFDIDWKGQNNLNMSIWNAVSGNSNPKFWHTSAFQYNIGGTGNTGDRMSWNYDNNYDSGPTPSGVSQGSEYVNSVDSRTIIGGGTIPVMYLGLDNVSTGIRNSGFFALRTGTGDNARGYDNATDSITMTSAYEWNAYNAELDGEGEAGLVAYDYFGNVRSASAPSIGAIELSYLAGSGFDSGFDNGFG